MRAFVVWGYVYGPGGINSASWTLGIPQSAIVATASLSEISDLGGQIQNANASASIPSYVVRGNFSDRTIDNPGHGPTLAVDGVEVISVTFALIVNSGYASAAFTIITLQNDGMSSQRHAGKQGGSTCVVYNKTTGKIVHVHHYVVMPGAATLSDHEIQAIAMKQATRTREQNSSDLATLFVQTDSLTRGHHYSVDITKRELLVAPLPK